MSRLNKNQKRTERYVFPYYGGAAVASTSQTPTAGRVYLAQCNVPAPGLTTDSLVFTTNTVAAGNAIAGIYRQATVDMADSGSLVVQSASTAISTTSTAQYIPLTATYLSPGTYYMSLTFSDATCTFNRHASIDLGTNLGSRFSSDPSYQALPNTCPATSAFTSIPAMRLRIVQ